MIKKFENYSMDDELILVMLNNHPIGLVEDNDGMLQAITNCIMEEGYEEVEIEDIEISESYQSGVGNRCRVDGSLINLHLIKMRVFEEYI